MDVKEAVRSAKAYLNEVFADEQMYNLGLEEIEHDDALGAWNVTLGFSRSWDNMANPFRAIVGDPTLPRRVFKVVKVREADGEVLSVKKLENAD